MDMLEVLTLLLVIFAALTYIVAIKNRMNISCSHRRRLYKLQTQLYNNNQTK